MWLLEPLCTLIWLNVISLKFKWFWNVFGWKMVLGKFWVFLECSSLFLAFWPRTKSLVFWFKVLIYFIKSLFCFWIIEMWLMFLKGDRNVVGCVRSTSLTQTPHAWLYVTCTTCMLYVKTQINTHNTPFHTSITGHPTSGVLLGLLCNYIKFWYFCVFALWPKSLRFYV